MAERRPAMRIVRAVALVLALGAAVTSAAASCDAKTDATPQALDPGPTFGIEVTINVSGDGRVTSAPAGLDCPSSCFLRITSADREFDGADIGLTLTATPGVGSHFVGWKAQPLVSGTRARGPAVCSPMTRNALGPPLGPIDQTVILPYGETQGTAPKGREAECAGYTTVPVAYALVATFAEDPAQPFFGEDAAPPGEVLFEPPALGTIVAQEIGVRGDQLYFRYDQDGLSSAIAAGKKDGKSGLRMAIPPSGTLYRMVAIGPNIVVQDQNFVFRTLNLATMQSGTQSLGVSCSALATDNDSAYCRFGSGSQSYLYALSLDGGSFRYVYTLPFGGDLAVDDANVYFTEVPMNGVLGAATLETAVKAPDASGLPDASKLVPGLGNPSHLLATGTDLFWLDVDPGNAPTVVSHARKTGADAAATDFIPTAGVGIAVDPTDPQTFYAAASAARELGGFGGQIFRYHTDGRSFEIVLRGMESVNGLAVDESYVYWTQNDGRVYRAPK